MLIVAPSGTTKFATDLRTPSFSSAVLIDMGSTAAELEVENASSINSRVSRRKRRGLRLARSVTTAM